MHLLKFDISDLQILNYDVVGFIDWCLCLNPQGGPAWTENYVDSAVIVFAEKQEFLKQPMFYALGHFSKFIPRGSRRIDVAQQRLLLYSGVDHVAFVTPRNTIVVVLYNE
jgi:O-glycosyl hydrolase